VKRGDCHRERDVIEAVLAGRWPGAADPDLRGHVDRCDTCAMVVQLAAALAAERDLATAEARVMPSGVMWWRAEMRARHEAARVAARPIDLALALTAAALVGFSVAFAGMANQWLGGAVQWFGRATAPAGAWIVALSARPTDPGFALTFPAQTAIWLAIFVWFIIAPVAIYLVVADD